MMKMNNKRHGRAVIVIMAMMMVGWPLNSNSQVPSIIRAASKKIFRGSIFRPMPPIPQTPPFPEIPPMPDLPDFAWDFPEFPSISINDIDHDYLFYHYITNPKDKLSKVYHEHFIPQQEIKKYFGSPFVPGIPFYLDSLNHYKYPYNSTFFPVQGIQGIHRNDTILCDSLLAVSHELGSYLKTKSYSEEQLKYLSNVKSNIDLAVNSVNPLVGLNLLSYYIEIADTVFQNEKPEEITQLFQRLNVIINENVHKKALEIMPLKERLKATTNSSSPRQ